jgi:hypothetical protein
MTQNEADLDRSNVGVKVPKGVCVSTVGCNALYAGAADLLAEVKCAANSWRGEADARRDKLEQACKQ